MFEIKMIKLVDLFSFSRGKVISKKEISQSKGSYPVYSSQTRDNGVLGYIDSYMFDGEFLTWTTDGVHAGTTFYRKGKFNCTNVCGIMSLKEGIDNIDLKYILTKLDLKKIAKSTGNKKVMSSDIEKAGIKIPIPVNEDGKFDLKVQKEISQKYEMIEEKIEKLKLKKEELNSVSVKFDKYYKMKQVDILDLFSLSLGSGLLTKTYCKENVGDFAVYSGQIYGSFSNISSYDYEGTYLTWSKDGFAGYLMYHNNERFSITNHRGILIPTDKCKEIDLEYIKFVLEPIFRKARRGRLSSGEKNEYTTLSKGMIKKITDKIQIPIRRDGTFDLEAQKEIANKYKTIDRIKKDLSERIDELINTKVVF